MPPVRAERGCVVRLRAHELFDLRTGGKLKGAGELSVERVLHDHIYHGAAVIHHDVQLCFHAVRRVPDCYPAHKAGSGTLNAIAPGVARISAPLERSSAMSPTMT